MITKTIKKDGWYIIVPDIFVLVHIKGGKTNTSIISLEALINLCRKLLEISVKDIILYYFVISATLTYGSQAKIAGKLIVDKKDRNATAEKTFQQTTTHHIISQILSNSEAAKVLQATHAIQYGLNMDAFGNIEEERSEEGFQSIVIATHNDLMQKKGSGSSKVSIKNPESRPEALRAKMASIRSKWCATPTYSSSKVSTNGLGIKNLTMDEFLKYFDRTNELLVDAEIVSREEIPNRDELTEYIKETISDLGISSQVDDSDWGTFGPIPLEEDLFGISRTSNVKITSKEPLPDFISQMKSDKTIPKKKKQESKN